MIAKLNGSRLPERSSFEPPPFEPLPPDPPPGFDPPGPRPLQSIEKLSARFIARLRRDYGRGVAGEEGRAIGELAEVRAWLDSLPDPATRFQKRTDSHR